MVLLIFVDWETFIFQRMMEKHRTEGTNKYVEEAPNDSLRILEERYGYPRP